MRRALGKGLSQLIAQQIEPGANRVSVDRIVPNQRQPRTHFDAEGLQELADSIREHGILQPLIVRAIDDGYELIAGERRWRAAKLAGLDEVPVSVLEANDQASLEIAIIENIQRQDINPVECARGYRQLIDEFGLTQEQVATKVARSRAAVANAVRLLRLPDRCLDAVEQKLISEGHARALLALEPAPRQLAMLDLILRKGLTVRDVENAAKEPLPKKDRSLSKRPVYDSSLEEAISTHFGFQTKIARSPTGGKVQIDFYSEEDLDRIVEVLGIEI